MDKIYIVLFTILHISFSIAHDKNPDCVSPTEYFMQFLPKSTTIWRGSSDWKETIEKNDCTVQTVYARTRAQEYAGSVAQFLILRESGIKLYFSISRKGDTIEIDSTIEDHEVATLDSDQAEKFKQELKNCEKQMPEDLQDYCSKCTSTFEASCDEISKKSHVIFKTTCKTTMPYALFKDKISQ